MQFADRHEKESRHLPTSISYKTSKAALNMREFTSNPMHPSGWLLPCCLASKLGNIRQLLQTSHTEQREQHKAVALDKSYRAASATGRQFLQCYTELHEQREGSRQVIQSCISNMKAAASHEAHRAAPMAFFAWTKEVRMHSLQQHALRKV